MTMPTDTVTVTLPSDLAAFFGVPRLEVEAVAMSGAAIFEGASVDGKPVNVPSEHRKALEALFCAAMKAKVTDDLVTMRDADARHRKAPMSAGKVRHDQPRHVSHYARRAGRMA